MSYHLERPVKFLTYSTEKITVSFSKYQKYKEIQSDITVALEVDAPVEYLLIDLILWARNDHHWEILRIRQTITNSFKYLVRGNKGLV